MNTRNVRTKLSSEQIKKLWETTALFIDWGDGSDSLLQENGYTLKDALAFEEEGYSIFIDGNEPKIMEDNRSQIVEDIKYILFNDREFQPGLEFTAWTGNGDSFIVTDDDSQRYKVTVSRVLD